MKKTIRLSESELVGLVKRILKEQNQPKPFKKNTKGNTVKTCFDFDYLKMIAEKNGLILKKSSGMCGPFEEGDSTERSYELGISYPNVKSEPCLTLSSKNGQLEIDLLQKEPLNISFHMELDKYQISKLKQFSNSDEGESTFVKTNFDDLQAGDTRLLNKETPDSVYLWFEDPQAVDVQITCGDYEKILKRLGTFSALVKFLGPNFSRNTWNYTDD